MTMRQGLRKALEAVDALGDLCDAVANVAALPDDDFAPADWDRLMHARGVAQEQGPVLAAARMVIGEELGLAARRVEEAAAADEARAAAKAARAEARKVVLNRSKALDPEWTTPADYAEARAIVANRSGRLCEVRAEGCTWLGTATHHRAHRGFPGCHHPDLLLWVCNRCHDEIHAFPSVAMEKGWLLPRGTTADQVQS